MPLVNRPVLCVDALGDIDDNFLCSFGGRYGIQVHCSGVGKYLINLLLCRKNWHCRGMLRDHFSLRGEYPYSDG